ncbi:MAG: V-type ATP synthase subunit D [Candidatus Nezhaarchaeales archaeon]
MSSIMVKPTRMELIALKRRRVLAQRGLSLLKEKRDALIMELLEVLREYGALKAEASKTFVKAFKALINAKMDLGALKLWEYASSSPTTMEVKVRFRNVMGVTVPSFSLSENVSAKLPPYSLTTGRSSLDEAVKSFKEALSVVVKLAEVEASIRGLADEVRRAKRRVNALEMILIPRLEKSIRYIEAYLDERAREDVFRIKILKSTRAKHAS